MSEEIACRRVLAAEPGSHAVLRRLYSARYGGARYGEALHACRRALALMPDDADDRCNLGEILSRLDRRDEAEAAFARSIVLDPQHAEALRKRGVMRQRREDLDAAFVSYNRALALGPGDIELQRLRLSAAIADETSAKRGARFRQILASPARAPDELLFHGCAFAALGRHEEARRAHSQALALTPDAAEIWHNRAAPLTAQMRIEEAVRNWRRALAISPDHEAAHSNVIFWIDLVPGYGFAEHQAERRRWAAFHRRAVAPASAGYANRRDPDKVIRLGYVSSDFKRHSAAEIFGTVIRRHDRSRFEVYLYSGVPYDDEVTREFRSLATAWRSTLGLSPDALATQIRGDQVDVLMDLSGHTAGHHLATFLRRPAPVQVTGWGNGTGSGLKEIDYFFADPVVVPAAVRHLFEERIYDLPCFITFPMPERLPDVTPPPAAAAGRITYGCFNRASKISTDTIRTWARLLDAVPSSRLLLKDRVFDEPATRAHFRDAFLMHGISPGRLDFIGLTSRYDQLSAHAQVDIALDPFPANGGASTCEALMMGVPVVALAGAGAAARAGAALLSAVGLPEWVAADTDAYVRIAAAWARRVEDLAVLRGGLRRRYGVSSLGDPDLYTRAGEAAFREIWRRWCERAA